MTLIDGVQCDCQKRECNRATVQIGKRKTISRLTWNHTRKSIKIEVKITWCELRCHTGF